MKKCRQCGRWYSGPDSDHVCVDLSAPMDCAVCGKPFRRLRADQKCCSRRCRSTFDARMRAQRRKEEQATGSCRLYENVCAICGQSFQAKSAKTQTCSLECANIRRIRALRDLYGTMAQNEFVMPDVFEDKRLYFDGLHPVRDRMPGREVDPMLGF